VTASHRAADSTFGIATYIWHHVIILRRRRVRVVHIVDGRCLYHRLSAHQRCVSARTATAAAQPSRVLIEGERESTGELTESGDDRLGTIGTTVYATTQLRPEASTKKVGLGKVYPVWLLVLIAGACRRCRQRCRRFAAIVLLLGRSHVALRALTAATFVAIVGAAVTAAAAVLDAAKKRFLLVCTLMVIDS